jgi:hypothetical protein
MRVVRVSKAKPNPWGKDRTGGMAPKSQIAAEWIDIKNVGDEAVSLGNLYLNHVAYQSGCRDGKWQYVCTLCGTILPGQVARVHSGGEISVYEMNTEDVTGADYHLFTGRGYIWNNDCGDEVALWDGQVFVDKAGYEAYPPEGRILVRQGDKLVPTY